MSLRLSKIKVVIFTFKQQHKQNKTKNREIIHILCMIYQHIRNSVNVNYWYCCLNTREDAENMWGDILEKYLVYGSQLPRGLKWSCSEALVTYCVQLS